MNVKILHLLEGARQAKGLTVIIDVFRAFSTACYAFDSGAQKIIPVALIDEAFRLKEQNPEYLLIGERNEIKPEGFDYGNSPSQLPSAGVKGRVIVHTTSSGTQGIAAAAGASEIITGSFVNAGAIIKYIRSKNPDQVSLVCMGYACEYPTDEDTLCAEYILQQLNGEASDFNKMVEIIRKGSGARFFDAAKQGWSPREDFDLCLDLNRFEFILRVEQDASGMYLRKLEPPFNCI
ncbi:MAG: 2-phosphosulfolactate phosphatase [Mariniphaga sp.]